MEKNKELTPMMELIEELELASKNGSNPFILTTINLIIDIAKELLPKEKQVTDELVSLLMQTTEYEVLQSFRDKVDKYNNQIK